MPKSRFMNNRMPRHYPLGIKTRLSRLPRDILRSFTHGMSAKQARNFFYSDPAVAKAVVREVHNITSKNWRIGKLKNQLNKVPYMGKNFRHIVSRMQRISPTHPATRSAVNEVNKMRQIVLSLRRRINNNEGVFFLSPSNKLHLYNANNKEIRRIRNNGSGSNTIARNVIRNGNTLRFV